MVLVPLAAGALVALMLDGSCAGAAEVAAMKAPYAASPKWPPPPTASGSAGGGWAVCAKALPAITAAMALPNKRGRRLAVVAKICGGFPETTSVRRLSMTPTGL
jgi:hypothetical protein